MCEELVFQMQSQGIGLAAGGLNAVQNACCPKCPTAQNDPGDDCYSFCNHDCCPNGDDPCTQDPDWVNMPMGTSTSGQKINYCERCASISPDGNPANGNFPVDIIAGYWYPGSTNYCYCCEPIGCESIYPPSNPGCAKCLSNQAAGIPNPGLEPNVTTTGFNVGADCECCEDTHEESKIKCQCCKNGSPISMGQEVPSNPGCSVLNNPAAGIYNCQTHPMSGGPNQINCKKPGTGHTTMGPSSPVAGIAPTPPTSPTRNRIGELKKVIKNIY